MGGGDPRGSWSFCCCFTEEDLGEGNLKASDLGDGPRSENLRFQFLRNVQLEKMKISKKRKFSEFPVWSSSNRGHHDGVL